MTPDTLAWPGILLLGAWHGINPGMGWLFAVALGMQDRSRRAVWRALPPLAVGHGIAVAGTALLAAAAGLVVPAWLLTWAVAAMLVILGIVKLVSSRHPRYGGMRVNQRELTVWSALMATAHGAGLMVVPFLLHGKDTSSNMTGHAAHMASVVPNAAIESALVATLVHTVGYLGVAGLLAWLVYTHVGVAVLRRWWVNLDLTWAIALIITGLLTVAPRIAGAQQASHQTSTLWAPPRVEPSVPACELSMPQQPVEARSAAAAVPLRFVLSSAWAAQGRPVGVVGVNLSGDGRLVARAGVAVRHDIAMAVALGSHVMGAVTPCPGGCRGFVSTEPALWALRWRGISASAVWGVRAWNRRSTAGCEDDTGPAPTEGAAPRIHLTT